MRGIVRLMSLKNIHIFAPAKINLFLHITGKRADGYHTLQSLVAFADVGDELEFSAQENFQVEVRGPFAAALPMAQDNLVYKAARLLSEDYKTLLQGKIILTKNLPVASGIGGGSADAAATLKGLVKLWNLPDDPLRLQKIAQLLGADVPACLYGGAVWVEGTGELLTGIPDVPDIHFVLVNPLIPTPTAAVFKNFRSDFSVPIEMRGMSVADLKTCRNDLTEASLVVTPVARDVLTALGDTKNCLLHRLSGSGATCFGLYDSVAAARAAAETIKKQQPDWWCVQCMKR